MKSDDDRIDREDPKTALDMDGELNFDCCNIYLYLSGLYIYLYIIKIIHSAIFTA